MLVALAAVADAVVALHPFPGLATRARDAQLAQQRQRPVYPRVIQLRRQCLELAAESGGARHLRVVRCQLRVQRLEFTLEFALARGQDGEGVAVGHGAETRAMRCSLAGGTRL
ncbi:MAG: hypothetical protein IPN77_11035 [Sandaracinaceae bacterium]|nr:hypothetical protein [Sandaracinaceae bacterium]